MPFSQWKLNKTASNGKSFKLYKLQFWHCIFIIIDMLLKHKDLIYIR